MEPNTILSSCPDGTAGSFHVDESTDRIKVYTTDATALAAGKTIRIDVTVWAFSSASDALDLYHTANASASTPTWTYIGTLTPAGTGPQTLSTTFTLPAGSQQAVRARFRFQGGPTTCSTGTNHYDDHDDLVFGV